VKTEKKYTCIVKVGGSPEGGGEFKKWNLNNLLKFVAFLDREHPEWRYFNVFNKKTLEQVGSYTTNDRPSFPKLFENGEIKRESVKEPTGIKRKK